MSFASLGLSPALLRAVREQGYHAPTPVQAAALPPILAGADVLALAQTGSGKTAAFILPALEKILAARGDNTKRREKGVIYGPRVLVLAPTRELAMQVAEALKQTPLAGVREDAALWRVRGLLIRGQAQLYEYAVSETGDADEASLLAIAGVGPAKLARYGPAFLRVLREP